MSIYTVEFHPYGPLQGALESDTLFGAVCWAIRMLDLTDVGKMLADFEKSPRFAFSSVFPMMRAREGAPVRFYPLPALPKPRHAQVQRWANDLAQQNSKRRIGKKALVTTQEKVKRLEKVTLTSEAVFTQIVSGWDWDDIYPKIGSGPGLIEQANNALLTFEERKRCSDEPLLGLLDDAGIQHNQIDRVRGATAEGLLFYEMETVFPSNVGLWAALWVADDADVERLVRPSLRYLADSGLGANRSVGRGHFRKIEVADALLTLPRAESANAFVTLSRYIPNDMDWSPDAEPLRYRLLNLWPKREKKYAHLAPKQSAPVYKRRARMFAPGSIFPNPKPAAVVGRLVPLVDAAPDGWTVYQSGLALTVQAKTGGESNV